MVSQFDLAKKFAMMEPCGIIPSASHVECREVEDREEYECAIVGYGWAVYAARRRDETIEYYSGWEGYSTATSTQLGKIRRAFDEVNADWETIEQQPEWGGGIQWRRAHANTDERFG